MLTGKTKSLRRIREGFKRWWRGLYIKSRLQGIGLIGMTELGVWAKKIGLAGRGGRSRLPPLDDRLRPHFQFNNQAAIQLHPVSLDVKQTENVRCLFVDGKQVAFGSEPQNSIPVFNAFDPNYRKPFCQARPPVSIVLDLHDYGYTADSLMLPAAVLHAIRRLKLQVIYLKLQVNNPSAYAQLNPLPEHIHVLTVPMWLGGSRFHITSQTDFVGDALFRNLLVPNPSPEYKYNWMWVGNENSPDRIAAAKIMKDVDQTDAFVVWTKPCYDDVRLAALPRAQYLNVMRLSRICLSLNGHGPWCLRDGELISSHAFCLRQAHPILTFNPLSPQHGKHWFVFKTPDLGDAIKYFLANPREREQIRDHGFEYFRSVLEQNLYAREYGSRLAAFLQNPVKQVWGPLVIG
jgi:hypothetical protein